MGLMDKLLYEAYLRGDTINCFTNVSKFKSNSLVRLFKRYFRGVAYKL